MTPHPAWIDDLNRFKANRYNEFRSLAVHIETAARYTAIVNSITADVLTYITHVVDERASLGVYTWPALTPDHVDRVKTMIVEAVLSGMYIASVRHLFDIAHDNDNGDQPSTGGA